MNLHKEISFEEPQSEISEGRTDHPLNLNCPKAALPSAHHVVNEIAYLDALVL